MQDIVIFILSVSGLSWILTKGSIFKPMREIVTLKSQVYEILVRSTLTDSFRNNFYKSIYGFFNGILNCHGCIGLWSGLLCYGLYLIGLDFILYGFAGVSASLLIIGLVKFLDKK